MKSRTKNHLFILAIMLNLSLVLISPTVRAEYQLGFTETTRLTLIYEYTEVDSDLLEYLADSTGVEEYEDLAEIDEGDKFKMVISNIDEEEEYWLITSELYTGKNLDLRGEDLETKVYKRPKDLVDKIFDSDTEETSSLYFMPLDTKDYLEKFEEIVVEDDEYLEVDYELTVDDTELTFDYTYSGYSDTLIQEYKEDGILLSFEILCDGEGVFKRELIDSYEDYSIIIYTVSIIIVSIVAILCISIFIIIKKKKKEPLDPKVKVNKMLKDIK